LTFADRASQYIYLRI